MDRVAVEQIAQELGITRRHVLRFIEKKGAELGVVPERGSRNAVFLMRSDADRIVDAYRARPSAQRSSRILDESSKHGYGYFYVIQLHPDELPARVKIGYTDNVAVPREGVPFAELDVTDDDDKRRWLLHTTGSRTVPQIFFGDEGIGGCRELEALVKQGVLKERLAAPS